MNIFDFAIEFERELHDYYQEKSKNAPNEYMRKLFAELAAEELKHEQIVLQLRAEKMVEEVESDIKEKARDFFQRMVDELPEMIFPEDEVEIYKQAVELERKSKEFYLEQAEKADLAHVRRVFKQLAEEERKHQEIMENLAEMLDRPNTWLEDAEWNHMEEY
ncbi:MAG: ferritin family protein [Halanaerobiales bacterium]|jgi:rubrerythrin|nr:ferritin family protein [Bacillota bacterium]HOA40543.1 ferritin family protein [Halanaerobiales bacterium]HPZ62731.1 ferritin family protein [Halanaerobiales bacterium]HQD04058.1 ferritin family protein [Halanaerobiales bacterium]